MRAGLALWLAALASGALAATPAPRLPAGAYVLPAAKITEMLRQCSRGAPAPGEGSWRPDAASIIALERSLPAALRAHDRDHDWSGFPQKWARQYVGIVRNGRRIIYGNYVPGPLGTGSRAAAEVFMVCDGGPSFFGAEYDVAAGKITHLAFNGVT